MFCGVANAFLRYILTYTVNHLCTYFSLTLFASVFAVLRRELVERNSSHHVVLRSYCREEEQRQLSGSSLQWAADWSKPLHVGPYCGIVPFWSLAVVSGLWAGEGGVAKSPRIPRSFFFF